MQHPNTDSETNSFDGDRIEVQFEFDGIAHNGLVRLRKLQLIVISGRMRIVEWHP